MAEAIACFADIQITAETGKLTLSQSGTLSTISSSLGCILLLLDTWALVDAPVEEVVWVKFLLL
ncbi:hypothetical protein SLEP1_g25624 [Rubroshorea leprosula]|uniref:Uncharacterized protein n=1 Tax=Rubroshorea leprosula TaxID=152421 RepID=A0AAV5JTB5_9ROSI|nr:hypothetical protein SLEP1_g25624 [Rubroshorea leprosula]